MGGPPVFKGSSAAPARPLAQPSDVQGARPRVGRRRRNDGDQWVERGKRGASERGTPLCYSGSSSSFIRSAAISATFVTDPRSLRACVCFPDLSPIAEQQQQRGEGGEEEEEEEEEKKKKKKKKKKNANHNHFKPTVERFWTNFKLYCFQSCNRYGLNVQVS